MANTKTHPGAFRCYEAALPDEPIFVILGRDPAGPATLEFWAQERINQGKDKLGDDAARIGAAMREADDMRAWREKHLDPMGDGVPSWKLPRPSDLDDRPPVCVIPDANGGDYAPSLREAAQKVHDIRADLAEFDGDRRGIAAALQEAEEDLLEAVLAALPDQRIETPTMVDEEEARLLKYHVGANLRWLAEQGDRPGRVPMGMLTGAFLMEVANTLDGKSGPRSAHKAGIHLQWIHDRLVNVHNENAGFDYMHKLREIIGFINRGPTVADEAPVIDSEPHDLAHAPEVPHHRFSVFHKGDRYAYARGLEVNPIHLPVALDAMAKSGWHLVAIFGQTDSTHIGLIFERRERTYTALEVAHGFGYPPPEEIKRMMTESPAFQRFKAGEPLDTIIADEAATGACGIGRGQEP